MRLRAISAALLALALLPASAHAASAPITNSGDDLRTGWYPEQSSLTPGLVTGGTFGRLWSAPVEGQVYGQPLLDGSTLLVATEQDKAYGLNPATGAQLWKTTLKGTPWKAADIGCGDLTPTIGVTSTPVIDPTNHIAYMTHKAYASGSSGEAVWYMDALDMANGQEEPGFPVELSGEADDAPGLKFHPTTELQRPGLLLMEGVVYAAFGAHCDILPYRGWVFGVSTEGKIKARWADNESDEGAGIWQSGAGLTSDGPGTILLSTGNGGAPTEPAPGNEPPENLGESIVRLRVQGNGTLKPVDFFAPFDASSLDTWDADFASGGVTGLPNEYFGTAAIPHLAVAVGKDGYVYLLNRDNLGGIAQGPGGGDNVVQRIGPYGGVWSRPGVWPGEGGWVYIPTASAGNSAGGSSGNLRVYQYGLSAGGAPTLSLQGTSSDAFGFTSGAPVITSDGTTPGSALVWIEWVPNEVGEGAELRAYEPVPVSGHPVEVWHGPIGTASKFALPGVGAGRLYVGTRDGHVLGFGSPVTPVLSGGVASFSTTTVGETSHTTLKLTATEPLTVTHLESGSPDFSVEAPTTPALPATLGTGETIEVPLSFTPSKSGLRAGTLTAETSTGKTATFSMSGTGREAGPKLELSPIVVTFGGTTVGEPVSAAVTVHDVGGEPLTIEEVTPPGAPFSDEAPKAGTTIEPGEKIAVPVQFEPVETSRYESEIIFKTNGGEGTVVLSGTAGLPGALQITPEAISYGKVALGQTVARTFTVTNSGSIGVTITKSKPPTGGEFSAVNPLSEGSTIEPGETVHETVDFAPTETGEASTTWVINGHDSTGLHTVQFSGLGIVPPPPAEEKLIQEPPGSMEKAKTAAAVPDAQLTSTKLSAARGGGLAVRVSCPASEKRCTGTVTLRTLKAIRLAPLPGSKTPRSVILTLASGSFAVSGGKTVKVTLHLSARGRELLLNARLLHLRAIVVGHDAAGAVHTSHALVTLRLA